MLDISTRLLVAYGLIAAMLLAAAALAFWSMRNSWQRRDARDRARQARRYQARDAARSAERATADDDSGGHNTIGTTG